MTPGSAVRESSPCVPEEMNFREEAVWNPRYSSTDRRNAGGAGRPGKQTSFTPAPGAAGTNQSVKVERRNRRPSEGYTNWATLSPQE
ncbi:hypothetical protein R1flu_020196 [Riccia fluitans]|uniref:Uncharacterized protein n=1 Tax=Riccia fluitans TaxID=41844 RepID=A0ABD1ZL29_9MARC